ncbi:calmodulin-like [Penaeus monodon]|uniref:calmodulin-like n=1 Tax=Penaeus monodon TaxID=6687 RepID=UPI0018A72F7E|nr:calmodulin-like [Penaeus monodon]XP_037786656.1 calmodulin-like [Penaeus monodon]
MPRKLRPEEMKEAKECFSIFALNGAIPIDSVGNALRSMARNPSNAEVKALVQELGNPAGISLETFVGLLGRDFTPADSPEEIREAFGVFDKDGNGVISANELKHVLMTMGEKLSQEEVDIMIREADIDGDGHIKYEQFVDLMTKSY